MNLRSIAVVGRRELTVRLRTRSFQIGTIALVIGVLVLAFVPVIVRWIEGSSTTQVAVWAEPGAVASDPAATLSGLLNAPGAAVADAAATSRYVVSSVPDVERGRIGVADRSYAAFLAIGRRPDGDLAFTLYTDDLSSGRVPELTRQVATTLAIQDRLARSVMPPA